MGVQIVGRVGGLAALEVGWSGHRDEADLAAEFHRDHVLRDGLQKAHAGVESLFDDVDQPAFRDEIEFDPGVQFEKSRNDVPEQDAGAALVRVDPQLSAGCPARLGQRIERLIEILKERIEPREQPGARLGRRHAARRAVQQADAQLSFQPDDRVAERRTRHAHRIGGLAETAVAGDRCRSSQSEMLKIQILSSIAILLTAHQ